MRLARLVSESRVSVAPARELPATAAPHAQAGHPRTEHDRGLPVHQDPRSPRLMEALARLEAAARLRDEQAAARILADLALDDDGRWLLRQFVAAGLREVAHELAAGA